LKNSMSLKISDKKGKYSKKGVAKTPLIYLSLLLFFLLGVFYFSSAFGPVFSSKCVSYLNLFKDSVASEGKEFCFPDADMKPVQGLFLSSSDKFSPEPPDYFLVGGDSVRAVSPAVVITPQVLGDWAGEPVSDGDGKDIIEYAVQEGDSLWSIASSFKISMETLFWANDLKSLTIAPGAKFLVLPVTGVMHVAEEGDTVLALAEKYKASREEIVSFNDLYGEESLLRGQVIIVPGGKMGAVSILSAPKTTASSSLSTNNFYGKSHAFPYGQCTWWVAQKRAIGFWGNAKDWINNAVADGFSVCRGSYCVPQIGAVVSLAGHKVYGHVAYVEEVKGDKIVFSEMNYIGLGKMNYRTLKIGSPSIKGYIY